LPLWFFYVLYQMIFGDQGKQAIHQAEAEADAARRSQQSESTLPGDKPKIDDNDGDKQPVTTASSTSTSKRAALKEE
jgi:hypothetical protein